MIVDLKIDLDRPFFVLNGVNGGIAGMADAKVAADAAA